MIILYVYTVYTAMWIRRGVLAVVVPGCYATCYYDDVLEHKSFLRGHR